MADIVCRIVALPITVNAVTVVDEEGTFNVYVNAELSREAQKKAFDHERRHILRGHFYSEKAVTQCEHEANR